MENNLILQINSLTRKISKQQAEFNRLTVKIEALSMELKALKEGYNTIHRRILSEAYPLQQRMVADRITIVKLLNNLYNHDIFRNADRRKLAHLMSSLSIELIRQEGIVELIPIFNTYNEVTYEEMMEKPDAYFLGVDWENQNDQHQVVPEPDENWERYSHKVHADKNGKSGKKAGNAERRVLQEQKQSKSVRSVYLELVKAFHPDRELDEQEKDRKTEIMGRVTEAYRSNDLLLLLNLQMEYNHIDQGKLDLLADEQLLYYNRVLKQQVTELEKQKMEVLQDLASMVHLSPDTCDSLEKVLFQFNKQVKNLKTDAKNLHQEINSWGDPYAVREFLKNYRTDD